MKQGIGNIMDKNNKVISKSAEKTKRWKKWVVRKRKEKMRTIEPKGRNVAAITRENVEKTLKRTKNDKIMWPDEIQKSEDY